jgi:hypothetical protein
MRQGDPAARPNDPPKVSVGRASRSRRSRRTGLLLIASTVLAWLVIVPATPRPVAAAGDPVIAAAGDIACDPADAHFNGSTSSLCQQRATANLLANGNFAAVLSLGDNQYYCGSLAAYQQSYDLSWGRVKAITHPVVGNHEYLTHGGTTPSTGCDTTNNNAAGYFAYFGSAAGPQGKGYYSFNVGAWHLIALNTNCSSVGGCSTSSPQGKWLAADLAAHANQCTLAYWHIPLFSSGGRANNNSSGFWQLLYAAHADIVLDGHDHLYERFAPQTPAGVADPTKGILEITVGTGGADHTSVTTVAANSVVRNSTTFGVLALTLHAGSYAWAFKPTAGTFTDSGSATCHSATAAPTPTPTAAPTATPTAAPTATPTAAPTPTPTAAPTATPTATPVATATPAPATTTFAPAADSYVDASAPTTTHGTATALRVDASPVVRSLLRFNVTGLTGTLTRATLRVWATSAQATGYDAYSVADNTWVETTVDDANAPPFGVKLGSSGAVAAGTWTSVDVTSDVTGDGTYSLGLSTTNSTALALSSREGTNPPQLVITTTGGAAVLPPVPPSRPNPPNPILPALYLLIPVMVPSLLAVDRLTGRRFLGGPRKGNGTPAPGLLALAQMAFSRRSLARRALGLKT